MNEQYSDEVAVEGFDKKLRLSYSKTLIKIAEKEIIRDRRTGAENFFGNSNYQIKRRIDTIMCRKKKSVLSAIILGVFLCVLGSSAALAYETPIIIHSKEANLLPKIDFEEFIPENNKMKVSNMSLPYEDCFVSEQGEIYQFNKQDEEKAICNHTFVSGTRKVHTPKSNGGCTMKYYEAERCSLCGFTKSGDLIKTETYPTCSH